MSKSTAYEHFYPEVNAGGFSHVDSTVDFYSRINALLRPDMVVLDFGAGRGAASESKVEYVTKLRTIRGKVEKFIGADLDPVVLENPFVDAAIVLQAGQPLPIESSSIDLIISDWVFEHIEDVEALVSEFHRILKPGGWVCARTPNQWGYIAVAATVIPPGLHGTVLKWTQPDRKEMDVFPKFYKLNTLARIAKHFKKHGFSSFSYAVNSEPAYAGNSKVLWRAFHTMFRMSPTGLNAILHVFLRKDP